MIVIIIVIGISGWAIYHTACFLVEDMEGIGNQGQREFNATLLKYFWFFSIVTIVVGGALHFYFTRKLIKPIRQMIRSTKLVKKGQYPKPIHVNSKDEVGLLIDQYNGLISQLKLNEEHRHKLVANLSHEFRTPLSNLKGYLDALQNGVIKGDQDLYAALYEEANRLNLMIDQLEQLKEWDYIQSQTMIKKQLVEIADLIHQSVAMFELKLSEKNIPYEVDVEPQQMNIQVEGIQQVISNLLDNAVRYYQGDEKISIKGEIVDHHVYFISVIGPSKPIPDSKADKIFNRFYRLDDSRSRETGGSGLGLAIAKEIVEKHHGEIGVITIGEKNMFWFSIPLVDH